MAYQFDKPDYTLTEQRKREIEEDIRIRMDRFGKHDLECIEIEEEQGYLCYDFDCETNTITTYFNWADRDGDDDYFDLEEWRIEL